MHNFDDLIKRADELIQDGRRTLATGPNTDVGGACDVIAAANLRAASLSFIEMTFGRDHPYYSELDEKAPNHSVYAVRIALGILQAVRNQIASGWLTSARGLISAEVFSDFVEMADHFLEEGYKDPAAVMVGGVLEEHLRQLTNKHRLPVADTDRNGRTVPRKASLLNDELKKAAAYSAIDHKSVTAWLAVRNEAAHGNYSAYTADQVRNMLDGVTAFIGRTPL